MFDRRTILKQQLCDESVLKAALLGFEIELERIENAKRDVQRLLRGQTGSTLGRRSFAPGLTTSHTSRSPLNAQARKRIALAQKKRWKLFRAQTAGGRGKSTTHPEEKGVGGKKRALTSAARKAMSLAAKKRWAQLKRETKGSKTTPKTVGRKGTQKLKAMSAGG